MAKDEQSLIETKRKVTMRRTLLLFTALLMVGATAILVGPREALILLLGLGIGVLFEGQGFGFAGPWRRLIVDRNPTAILAQLLSIGLVATFALPLLKAAPQELIGAHAPVGFSMILGAFVFGAAMQIILGCGSGTLVNAGSGNLVAVVALPFFALGSFFGAYHLLEWTSIGTLPVVTVSGLSGVIITWAGLISISIVLLIYTGVSAFRIPLRLVSIAFVLAILALGHLVVAGQPWGVVYGLGLWAAKAVSFFGVSFEGSEFWSMKGQVERINQSLLTDVTSLTNVGLILGAFGVSAWRKGFFAGRAIVLPARAWVSVIIAGLALGYSSRLAFGCNVGAFFSGISTGSLHGWVWMFMALGGSIIGIRLRPFLGIETQK